MNGHKDTCCRLSTRKSNVHKIRPDNIYQEEVTKREKRNCQAVCYRADIKWQDEDDEEAEIPGQ